MKRKPTEIKSCLNNDLIVVINAVAVVVHERERHIHFVAYILKQKEHQECARVEKSALIVQTNKQTSKRVSEQSSK